MGHANWGGWLVRAGGHTRRACQLERLAWRGKDAGQGPCCNWGGAVSVLTGSSQQNNTQQKSGGGKARTLYL
jgi:hypothetical protein